MNSVLVKSSILYSDNKRVPYNFDLEVPDDCEDLMLHTVQTFRQQLLNGLLKREDCRTVAFRLNKIDGARPKIKNWYL